jgi:hypothetical protein
VNAAVFVPNLDTDCVMMWWTGAHQRPGRQDEHKRTRNSVHDFPHEVERTRGF